MTQAISIKIKKKPAEVRRASHGDVIERAALMLEAAELRKEEKNKSFTTRESLMLYEREQTFPSLMACTTMKMKLTFEEFLALDDTEVDEWMKAATKMNPHWFPVEAELDESLKKQTSSTSNSTE